jgi:hypothetical protein
MAQEAVIREGFGENNAGWRTDYTCASGATITKGTLLVLSSDPRTVIANSTGVNSTTGLGTFAGIATHTKDGTDFSTKITGAKAVVAELYASGAIVLGQKIVLANANYVRAATTADVASSYAIIIGHCLETASDAEQVECFVY